MSGYGHGGGMSDRIRAIAHRAAEAHAGQPSLYTPEGRLRRAVTFAHRDGEEYVTVRTRDLAKAVNVASRAALNPYNPSPTMWLRAIDRYLGRRP